MEMPEFSLVLPMYNEEQIAARVLAELQLVLDKEGIEYELVVVDNGSKDKTGEILETLHKRDPRIRPVHVIVNEGYTWGIACGLKEARGKILGFSDGDGQIDPQDILRVYKRLKETDTVFCKGTRGRRKDGWKRIVASSAYNLIFQVLFFIKIRDINGKPKIFKREFYDQITLESKDWFIDPELIIKLVHKGYKVEDVEIGFSERTKGKSNISYGTVHEFLRNMIQWRIALWKKTK